MEIAQLDELCSLIAEHRDVAEDTAKLDPAVVEAAGKAGLWVAGAPKEVGGLELGLADLLALCERIGEADASVAWHIVNSGGAGHAAAFVPDSIRRQVFASTLHPFGFSGAVAAGIKVARDTGGFRLAGTWPFMTGVLDADWACVTVVMPAEQGEDGQPPDVRRVFMPLGACEVHRTWDNATSMRGTGSHAVTADGVVVPVEATITYRAEPFIDRPAYRIPSHLPFVGGASAISIGILRSTIVGVIELCATKVSRLDGRKHFEDPRVQQYIADATAVADSLTANLEARAKVLDARYADGQRPGRLDRAHWWSAVFYTADAVANEVSKLYRIATSSAYGTRNQVERGLRDSHAITAAFESFQTIRRAAGAVLLGLEASHPLL